MIVSMKQRTLGELPAGLRELLRERGITGETEFDLTQGNEYAVHAVSVCQGIVFLQLIGDSGIPSWLPAVFFEVVNGAVDKDWMVNVFPTEIQFVLGPAFVTEDISAYEDMVELAPEKAEALKARIRERGKAAGDEDV